LFVVVVVDCATVVGSDVVVAAVVVNFKALSTKVDFSFDPL